MVKHIQRHDLWSDAEDDLLRSNFGDSPALQASLPNRTSIAIRMRAGRLGLDSGYRTWTMKEISNLRKLRPHYTIKHIASMMPQRSESAVGLKCASLKLRKVRQKPQLTGDELVDFVRAKAHEMRFSMYELDGLAKCRPYFQRSCLEIPRNNSALLKAILVLGGEIHWPD